MKAIINGRILLPDEEEFDKNIREYLGVKGKRGKTNKEIQATLLDEIERNRFFYYHLLNIIHYITIAILIIIISIQ